MASNKLFGVDIQAEIGKAFGGQLVPLTLHSVTPGTRNPSDPTAGTAPTTVDVTSEGIVDSYRESQIDGSLIQQGDKQILILGQPLGDVVPKPSDRVTIEGRSYSLIRVERDPAVATYTAQGRS